jgi:hypothetical protein
MKNKLIIIGFTGIKTCYLNVVFDEAVKRYIKSENITIEEFYEFETPIDVFKFDDEFNAYEVWEL